MREYLRKKYPHLLIPACPEHFSQTEFEEKIVRKKMELLSIFMNKVIQNEEIKASPVFVDFVSYKDKSQKDHSKRLKEEEEKVKVPEKLTDYQTLSGNYDIGKHPDSQAFIQEMPTFFKSHDAIYKKFNNLSKQLVTDLANISSTVIKLGECSADLAKMFAIPANSNMQSIYEKTKIHFEKWAKQIRQQSRSLYNIIPKYQSMEARPYAELYAHR